MAQRPRKSIQSAPMRTLAVLLLMNGEPVSAAYIARALGHRAPQTVSIHLATLKEHGVWQIVSERHYRRGSQPGRLSGSESTHRLVGLPPDELIDKVLTEVDVLKRSLWWADLIRSRRQRTA